MSTYIRLGDRTPAPAPLHCDTPAPICDGESFAEAQSKAREWADSALASLQEGNGWAASSAETEAEVWLARMLQIEAQMGQSTPAKIYRTSHFMRKPTALRTRPVAVTNNSMFRAWKRLPS